jgi:GAF domain-containing protein
VTIIIALLLAAIALAGQALTRPFVQASQFAARLARQDFAAEPLPAVGGDEIARLARALNSMKDSLAKQVSVLEAGILERSRNLEIAAEISRDAAQLHNIDELLKHTVNSIRQRFNFYHAQIFLLNDTREYAVLVTSTGEAGKELLARKHKLAVGSESVVGQATMRGRTVISLDTQDTGVPHRYNPLLPLTRSEMALPLRTGEKIIGALDIQSVERDAFDQEDVQIFQVLADQIAIAIDNARLIEDSARRVSQIDDLNRQLTRTSWSEYVEERTSRTLSYEYDLLNLKPTETAHPEERPTTNVETDIVVRGQTVGSLSVQESAEAPLTDEDRAVIQAVAERVALAVENARLVEQTQSALSRVEQLYQASRAFGSAVETREVYGIIAEQLSSFEFMDRITVMLARPDPNPDPPYFEYVFVWERTPVEASPFRVSARLSRIAAPFARLFPNPRLPRVADLDQDLEGYEATLDMFRSGGAKPAAGAPGDSEPLVWCPAVYEQAPAHLSDELRAIRWRARRPDRGCHREPLPVRGKPGRSPA